jgi:hypothetical protein
MEKSNHWHHGLLCPRSKRPHCRTAEQGYELAPLHVLPQPQDCSLPRRDRKYRVVHHSKFGC